MAVKKKDVDEAGQVAILAKIHSDLEEYYPGLWAKKVAYGPACACGLRDATCYRHGTRSTL